MHPNLDAPNTALYVSQLPQVPAPSEAQMLHEQEFFNIHQALVNYLQGRSNENFIRARLFNLAAVNQFNNDTYAYFLAKACEYAYVIKAVNGNIGNVEQIASDTIDTEIPALVDNDPQMQARIQAEGLGGLDQFRQRRHELQSNIRQVLSQMQGQPMGNPMGQGQPMGHGQPMGNPMGAGASNPMARPAMGGGYPQQLGPGQQMNAPAANRSGIGRPPMPGQGPGGQRPVPFASPHGGSNGQMPFDASTPQGGGRKPSQASQKAQVRESNGVQGPSAPQVGSSWEQKSPPYQSMLDNQPTSASPGPQNVAPTQGERKMAATDQFTEDDEKELARLLQRKEQASKEYAPPVSQECMKEPSPYPLVYTSGQRLASTVENGRRLYIVLDQDEITPMNYEDHEDNVQLLKEHHRHAPGHGKVEDSFSWSDALSPQPYNPDRKSTDEDGEESEEDLATEIDLSGEKAVVFDTPIEAYSAEHAIAIAEDKFDRKVGDPRTRTLEFDAFIKTPIHLKAEEIEPIRRLVVESKGLEDFIESFRKLGDDELISKRTWHFLHDRINRLMLERLKITSGNVNLTMTSFITDFDDPSQEMDAKRYLQSIFVEDSPGFKSALRNLFVHTIKALDFRTHYESGEDGGRCVIGETATFTLVPADSYQLGIRTPEQYSLLSQQVDEGLYKAMESLVSRTSVSQERAINRRYLFTQDHVLYEVHRGNTATQIFIRRVN